jgi:ADP-ribose pyrophosphatase YjhB (NUDIX family)
MSNEDQIAKSVSTVEHKRHELIARGVIILDGALLVNHGRNVKTGERYYALPGGHIDPGESSQQAVGREIEEELQAQVTVGGLMFVSESIYPGRHEDDGQRHELVLYFSANLDSTLNQRDGAILSPEADKEFVWLPLADLPSANLLPRTIKDFLLHQTSDIYGFSDDTAR